MKLKTKLIVFFLILASIAGACFICVPVYLQNPEMQIMLKVHRLYHLDFLTNQAVINYYSHSDYTDMLRSASNNKKLTPFYRQLDQELFELKTMIEEGNLSDEKRKGYLVYYDNIALRMEKLDEKFKSAYDSYSHYLKGTSPESSKYDYQEATTALRRAKDYGSQEDRIRPCKGFSVVRRDVYTLSKLFYRLFPSYRTLPDGFEAD
jgi:hypothetical protein